MTLIKENNGWVSPAGKPWTHIVPSWALGGFTSLLFYDGAGTGAFYTTDGQGGVHLVKEHRGWVSATGKPWTHIVPLYWTGEQGTSRSGLLFYDSAGTGAFWSAPDVNGDITPLKEHRGWQSAGKPWKQIIPFHALNPSSIDVGCLLFYDGEGTGAFYEVQGQGEFAQFIRYNDWRPNLQIIPAGFG